jgi:hypothetical protein
MTGIDLLALVACITVMAAFLWLTYRYFQRIRDGRADPVINPSWTTNMRPTSPPPKLHRPDIDATSQDGEV